MADIMKKFIGHMEGAHKARVFDAAAKAMAQHCDKRIAKAMKAIDREEKYLFKVLRARNTGGVMAGDIEGAFHRLRDSLSTRSTVRQSIADVIEAQEHQVDKYGLALIMIREGCADPRGVAETALAEEREVKP